MLTTALNDLAFLRFGGFHAGRGGGGFIWLVLGLAAIFCVVWAVVRSGGGSANTKA